MGWRTACPSRWPCALQQQQAGEAGQPCQRPGRRPIGPSRMAPQRRAACGVMAWAPRRLVHGVSRRLGGFSRCRPKMGGGFLVRNMLDTRFANETNGLGPPYVQKEKGQRHFENSEAGLTPDGHGGRPGGRRGHGHGGRPRTNLEKPTRAIAGLGLPITEHQWFSTDDATSKTR